MHFFHLVPAGVTLGPIAPKAGERFVHLCREANVDAVRRDWMFGQEVDGWLVDSARLDAQLLKEEDLHGHGSHPHYYGVISREAIVGCRRFAPITRSDFALATAIVRRVFPPTPLLFARRLSRRLSAEVWLKLESTTPIRAFKLRGALARMEHLPPGPVVTASGGNHGLAVAWAARHLGRTATVVMPAAANPEKAQAIEATGAVLLRHGEDYQAAHEKALSLVAGKGAHYVHAYDDPWVIAGQGTVGEELPEADLYVAGIGGGGLIAGLAAAIGERAGRGRVLGVQATGADSMARSLEAGALVEVERVTSIADGLGARRPGELNFALVRRYGVEVVRVTDEALVAAARVLLFEERLVAELAGAAGLAGLLAHPELARGRVIVVVSGANAADEQLARIIEGK